MKIELHKIICLLIICSLFYACNTEKQTTKAEIKNPDEQRDSFRIMFYNVENLFDIYNDPDTNDDDFTPEGVRNWNIHRYNTKLNQIYRVIVAVGAWQLPEIVAFCEIENKLVLEDLINKTPLFQSDYNIIHYDSPDFRGIDVGLIYRKNFFNPIKHYPIEVKYPENLSERTTRDILYVKGLVNSKDTLHIFVNHWPSRWGGELATKPLRLFCGKLLKHHSDSIFNINKRANVIILGDFNDNPTNRSLTEGLNAKDDFSKIKPNKLYNLSYHKFHEKGIGSLKFQGQWSLIDQFIVSGSLLDSTNNAFTSKQNSKIFSKDWLLEPDERHGGYMPYRTYIGFRYHGGYSDHLPIYLDIEFHE